jgi:Fic family protein
MPLVLSESSAIGKFVLSRNLGRQYDFLHTAFEVWRRGADLRVDNRFICELNFYAVQFMSEEPGIPRDMSEANVDIENSHHKPPRWQDVRDLMAQFVRRLNAYSGKDKPIEAAAYALWRLNWIHPFVQGNGRTARALAYFILCKELKLWLPGKPIIPERIRATRTRYEKSLGHADSEIDKDGRTDLSQVSAYLSDLLTKQLQDI